MTDAFFFAANAVLPILLMVLLGFMLKRAGLLTGEFLDAGNRLTFRVFLPVMLFINVYKIERLGDINIAFIVYGMAAVIVISLLAAAAS
ncbi:MAG: AEC family transporter, partial [Ruminococcus sp.]|nr:AEC family transporter [Ruminococcus sp.]